MVNRFQASQEISKIYHAITDRDALHSYFLQSLTGLLRASGGVLYLAGHDGKLWASIVEISDDAKLAKFSGIADAVQASAKPFLHKQTLAAPLVVRDSFFGVVCLDAEARREFSDEDMGIVVALSAEFASAAKNIELLTENMRMVTLATMGQTLNMVIHDFRNILQLAGVAEEMLEMGLRDKNEKFVALGAQKVKRALKEMDGYIWEMLSLTRDRKLETQKFSLKELFAELEDDLKLKTQACGAELKIEIPEDFPEVCADRRALYRSLLNLIKNAYEAKNKSTLRVVLSAERFDASHYLISVSDDGAGMTEETRAQLFQPFYSTKGEKGTGLGLLVVEKTVKLHQGELNVITKSDQGTRFAIKLPFEVNPSL